MEYFQEQLFIVNMQISKKKEEKYTASKVFVTFNTEKAQRECLKDMSVGVIPAALDWNWKGFWDNNPIPEKFLFKGTIVIAILFAIVSILSFIFA
jgi:hypothetical protein